MQRDPYPEIAIKLARVVEATGTTDSRELIRMHGVTDGLPESNRRALYKVMRAVSAKELAVDDAGKAYTNYKEEIDAG